MSIKPVNIRSEALFPSQFKMIAGIGLLAAAFNFQTSPYLSLAFLLIAPPIFTGFRGICFDRENNRYRSYYSVLFIKWGNWKELENVELLYINSSTVSRTIINRITFGSTYRSVEYNAYIMLENGTKEYLATSRDKSRLMENIRPLSEHINLPITDNSKN